MHLLARFAANHERDAMTLSSEQKALLKKLGLPTNFKNLSTDDRLQIDDVIGEELYENGIDETTDAPNAHGRLCESILEALED